MKAPSLETPKRVLGNLARPERYKKPVIALFYITPHCNGDCGFCSQTEMVENDEPIPPLETQLEVLRAIREDSPIIYITGGEPTTHPHLETILAEADRLNFDAVGLNTNGIIYRPEILDHADLLTVSLHSAVPEINAEILGVQPAVGEKILENIKRYALERDPQRTKMTLNCVLNERNLWDMPGLVRLCLKLGIRLSVTPEVLKNGQPNPKVIENPLYRMQMTWLTPQGDVMHPTEHCLKVMRDLSPFTCHPHTTPQINPNGNVIGPCPSLPDPESINLLEVGGLLKALRIGRDIHEAIHGTLDTSKTCPDQCHKACHIETSSKRALLAHALEVVKHKLAS